MYNSLLPCQTENCLGKRNCILNLFLILPLFWKSAKVTYFSNIVFFYYYDVTFSLNLLELQLDEECYLILNRTSGFHVQIL